MTNDNIIYDDYYKLNEKIDKLTTICQGKYKDESMIEKNSIIYYLLLLLIYFSYVFSLKVVQYIIYSIFPDNLLTNSIIGFMLILSIYIIFEKLKFGQFL